MTNNKTLFFIVGLPRMRSAWLANFLTNGDAFCHHELMRSCSTLADLKTKLEVTTANVVGDADPSLGAHMAEVLELFPEAKVVYIRRDSDEAYESFQKAFPSVAVNAEDWLATREKLIMPLHETSQYNLKRFMILDFEELEKAGTCQQLHEFCLGRPMDLERWKLLNGLRVTAIAEKARPSLAPWVKLELIRKSDPQNPASKLWEEITREICGDNKDAFRWLCDLKLIALTWDHIVDEDRVNILEADLCFEAMLLKWPLNKFWVTHQTFLAPVLANAVASWRHGSRIQHFECYTHPALAVAFLLGGPEYQARFAERVHKLAQMGCEQNDQLEAGHHSAPPAARGNGTVPLEDCMREDYYRDWRRANGFPEEGFKAYNGGF